MVPRPVGSTVESAKEGEYFVLAYRILRARYECKFDESARSLELREFIKLL